MAGCDHMDICRFRDENSPSYQQLWNVLEDWAELERNGQ